MSDRLLHKTAEKDAGARIDQFAAARGEELSRAEARRLIELDELAPGGIRVNGARVKPNYRLRPGDLVEIEIPSAPTQPCHALPEAIPLDIIYEDDTLLVINKARGMVVHPAPGSDSGTLVNAILGHSGTLSAVGEAFRPGIVHRLDKDTGGLLVVAKTDAAHRSLQSQIQAKTAERTYKVLVWGVPGFKQATVEAPIGRHPADRKKMAVITDPALTSRKAITEMTVVAAYFNQFALCEARLQTGRTHQIRVHCAYIHHPVVGDPVYGGVRSLSDSALQPGRSHAVRLAIANLNGQALHACRLAFDHPATGERMTFDVPAAEPMRALIEALEAPPTATGSL